MMWTCQVGGNCLTYVSETTDICVYNPPYRYIFLVASANMVVKIIEVNDIH